jgi:hypothetical protein
LGYDTSCGGSGNLRGLPTWDLDANIVKDIGIYRERVSAKFFVSIANVMNNFQASAPSLSLNTPNSLARSPAKLTRRATWSSESGSACKGRGAMPCADGGIKQRQAGRSSDSLLASPGLWL